MGALRKALSTWPREGWGMAAIALLLLLLLVPVPPFLLDLLLVLHLLAALALLLGVLWLQDVLEFSSFPSVLLFMALFRTALSVAVMRAILTSGAAGQLVATVGDLALGGNFLVGVVLLLTLILVQFVVVTGGANRIAEVAARFTLDSLPGKQMSIDADLSAGLITEEEARHRRRRLEQEADFYGAMDGAAKFVRGDAITALLVAALCFFGGLLVGIWQRGEGWQEALRTYGLLTVGQGLLIQIPALLVSAASSLIITRAASGESLGSAMVKETQAQPQALLMAALLVALTGLIPGLPKAPFLLMSLGLGAGAWFLRSAPLPTTPQEEAPASPPPEDFSSLIRVDPVEIELGFRLVGLALEREGGQLLRRITNLRRKLAEEMGLLVPPIRVRDNLLLPPHGYAIKVRGTVVAKGECHPHRFLAIGSPQAPPLEGIATSDPAFGLPAYWIEADQKREAERKGYTVVDGETALITHLSEVLKTYGPEILSRQEVQSLLDQVRLTHPAIVEEVVPQLLSRGEVHQVLRNLLAEGVPLRDMVAILEALADGARVSKDVDFLTERVRRRLARSLCQPFLGPEGTLAAVALAPPLERRLMEAVQETEEGRMVVPEGDLWLSLVKEIGQAVEQVAGEGRQPVLLCSASLRLPFQRLLARFLPRVPVLSYEEVNAARVGLQTRALVGGGLS